MAITITLTDGRTVEYPDGTAVDRSCDWLTVTKPDRTYDRFPVGTVESVGDSSAADVPAVEAEAATVEPVPVAKPKPKPKAKPKAKG